MKKGSYSRREFIGMSAAAAGASLVAKTIWLAPSRCWPRLWQRVTIFGSE
jgi:hypothetical protein